MSQLKFIDISGPGQGAVNWDNIETDYKSGTLAGVIIRAGYGGGGVDGQYATNVAQARQRSIPRQIYFYAYPGRSSGVQQANDFHTIVGSLQSGESISLDMEDDLTFGRALIASDVQWTADFTNTAKSLFGITQLTYMNSDVLSRFDWTPVKNLGSALWLANYGVNNGQPNASPNPYPWQSYTLWQYTSKGNLGGINPVDVNIFNGSIQDFYNLGAKGSQPPIPQPEPTPPATKTYTVASGDTLSGIASEFGTTVSSIVSLNESKYPSLASNPNYIQVGWVLTVSGSAPSQTTYTVVSGDNLSSIASRFGTTVTQLVAWNSGKYPSLKTNPNLIQPGWVLRVK